jgi:putative hydrolase of the HAD superfamily
MEGAAIRLVVFDAGGVIVRITGPWEVAQERAGVPRTELQAAEDYAAAIDDLGDRHQRGELETAIYLELMARASALRPDQIEAILDSHIADEYPGWMAVVDRLEASGVETALLSNTNAFHWQYLVPGGAKSGRYPAIGRLDRHFASHEMGTTKPDPNIYRAVEEATGHRGAEVLFFDDLPANVAAARELGWHAVLIDPGGDPTAQILAALDDAGL